MANSLPPSRSFFPGLALLFVGALLLVHNYRGLDISQLFHYWWPLIIIFWGAIKLYERAVASRSGRGISTISGGEILLVLGLLSLLGMVAASDIFRSRFPGLGVDRSEEHTSELQSRRDLVCRLLLEKKKNATLRRARSSHRIRPPVRRRLKARRWRAMSYKARR